MLNIIKEKQEPNFLQATVALMNFGNLDWLRYLGETFYSRNLVSWTALVVWAPVYFLYAICCPPQFDHYF